MCGEKKRKCLLLAFSPFRTMVSKAFFSRGDKSWDCLERNNSHPLLIMAFVEDNATMSSIRYFEYFVPGRRSKH